MRRSAVGILFFNGPYRLRTGSGSLSARPPVLRNVLAGRVFKHQESLGVSAVADIKHGPCSGAER